MACNINFNGQVYLTKNVEKSITEREFRTLAKAFKDDSQDVFVTRRTQIATTNSNEKKTFFSFYKLPTKVNIAELTLHNIPKDSTYYSDVFDIQ